MPKPSKPAPKSGSTPAASTPFTNTQRVKELLALMTEHGLTEIELVEADSKITLRRGSTQAVSHYAPAPLPAHAPAAPHAPGATPSTAATPAVPAADEKLLTIKSPMVGTFYTRPNPESAPFVAIGATINEESVVCVIEAMKVFNEIRAEVSGTIVKVLVQNGQAVEFNQPLFHVKTA
jgi:acetyl-CoA carboxylase biotin carboxyl carrier protein